MASMPQVSANIISSSVNPVFFKNSDFTGVKYRSSLQQQTEILKPLDVCLAVSRITGFDTC